MAVPTIMPQALLPGDVLLSCGSSWISEAILLIAGGMYSHSGLYDGTSSIDASDDGVKPRPLDYVLGKQRYVDAYRWHPLGYDVPLGGTDYPSDPVMNEAAAIVAKGPGFAYDELIMGGLVIAISGIPASPGLRVAARIILGQLQHLIHVLIPAGKRGMMCTEVVCTSFWKAAPQHRYAITIPLGSSRAKDLFKKASDRSRAPDAWASRALDDTSDATYKAVQDECARLVVEAGGPALKRSLDAGSRAPAPSFAQGLVDLEVGGPFVPLGCVSPHDLEQSNSLKLLGRLTIAPSGRALRSAAHPARATSHRQRSRR